MGDSLKISKDKRHRSSSSLAALIIEGTRSERKLDIRASIPEVDDHFAVAEARCDVLQEQIDLVKALKRKKKLKRRSMTRMGGDVRSDIETVPVMSIRTQPKKSTKALQQARLRRIDLASNPTRGYLDPATTEQHMMLENVQGYSEMIAKKQNIYQAKSKYHQIPTQEYNHTVGDSRKANLCNLAHKMEATNESVKSNANYNERKDVIDQGRTQRLYQATQKHIKKPQRYAEAVRQNQEDSIRVRVGTPPRHPIKQNYGGVPKHINQRSFKIDNRPEVELLFNKENECVADRKQALNNENIKGGRHAINRDRASDTGPIIENDCDDMNILREQKDNRRQRKVRYRIRRYEQPTISSQMKQSGIRYYYGTTNYTNIPFVASKSTAPSHNIGVNIQQVLNGMKIQQPLNGIPLTIAHHMGLRHVPDYKSTKQTPLELSLDIHEVNAIKVGKRLLRLPSHNYNNMSYNRLLTLYRQGEGMVPRFLRSISRPHYFYTSMYNLNTNREDMDGATSKGYHQEAKQSLAEYAGLYREYEKLDKTIQEGKYDTECETRKNQLSQELAAREEHIRRVVQEYRAMKEVDNSPLRASASTAEDTYRPSTFKLNKF